MPHENVDPREGPKPEFPRQEQEFPGHEADMEPRADHGQVSPARQIAAR